MSSGMGGMHVGLDIKVFEPCPIHQTPDKTVRKTFVVRQARWPFFHIEKRGVVPQCDCPKVMSGHTEKEYDMSLKQFAGLVMANCFDFATTGTPVNTTANTAEDITANSAVSAVTIMAGSGTSAPNAATDYVIQSALPGTDGSVAASCTAAFTSSTASLTAFQLTCTMTNAQVTPETYGNIGIYITAGGHTYMLAHDQTNGATGYPVSPSGTVVVTYTITCT
jgi:hypothetical protein